MSFAVRNVALLLGLITGSATLATAGDAPAAPEIVVVVENTGPRWIKMQVFQGVAICGEVGDRMLVNRKMQPHERVVLNTDLAQGTVYWRHTYGELRDVNWSPCRSCYRRPRRDGRPDNAPCLAVSDSEHP